MRTLRGALAPSLVVLVVLAQFAPVLRGRVYRFEDIAGYFEPLWAAASSAMRHGRLPVWEPGAWSGQPLVGDPQAGVFYPFNWLWLWLPVLRAYALAIVAHALWAGLGMYTLARLRGRSPAAAALAGVALGAGGFVVLQTRHVMFVEATAWLPWVAAAGWRFVEAARGIASPVNEASGAWTSLVALALSTGLLLLTGGVSMIYYGAWFVAALLLPLCLGARSDGRAARSDGRGVRGEGYKVRLRVLAGLAAAAALGLALAAPSLIPAAMHARLSPRGLGVDESFAASVAWSGFHLLPSLFVPNLLGQEVLGSYVGGGTQWEVAGYYAGLVPFALAMLALVRGEPQRRAERLAMGAMLVLAILLAPGLHSPVHRLAYHWLPLYAAMRCPARALYVFSLAVPLLAADGMDVLLARLGRRAWLDPATGPRLVRVLAVALPLVVAADLLWFQRAENPSLTLAEAHAQAFPPVAAFLRQHPGDRYVNDVHLDHALHNSGLLWGVENASGYSSIPLWRYLHFLWIANHGAPYPHARLHDDLAAQGLWRFSSPLVDALNVRWVIAPAHRPPDGPGFVRRFPDASNGPGGDDGAMVVYENLEALPRGWIVHRARVVGSEHAAALAVADPSLRPAEEVILEAEPSVAPRTGAGVVAGGDEIEDMTSMTPMAIEWGVRARTPGLLVASLPLHPGWHALVDGKAAPVLAADYALMAVAVPAGRHTVSLRYEAADVDRGLAVGAGAALVLLGAVLGAGIRERRTRRRNEAART